MLVTAWLDLSARVYVAANRMTGHSNGLRSTSEGATGRSGTLLIGGPAPNGGSLATWGFLSSPLGL